MGTHFSSINLVHSTVAGRDGAGTVTVAGISTKDTIVSVIAIAVATGVMAEDITSACTISAADTITSADASDYSTGYYLDIWYLKSGK